MAVRETLELDITRALAQVQVLGAQIDKATNPAAAGGAGFGGLTQGLASAGNAAQDAAGKTDQFADAQRRASSSAMNHSESLRATSNSLLVFGGAMLAAGGLAVAAFSGLETALAPVGTLLGANTAAAHEMNGALTDLVRNSPQSADEIGMSAYVALSAGIKGTEEVLKTVTASQKLAEAGLGDLAGATNIVTSAVNSFTKENLTAHSAAQLFFGAITLGKTTTADLAQGFGQIAPLAAATGVSFKELLSATAALTGTGMQASVAYTGLRGILTNLLKPSQDAAAAAAQLGIDFSAAHLQAVGLHAFLGEIATAANGNVDVMSKLFGSVEGLNAALALTGPQAEAFAGNLQQIDEAGQGLDDRAKEIENTVGNRLKTAFNNLKVDLAQIAEPFLPAVDLIVGGLGAVGDAVADMPGPLRAAELGFVGLTGVISLGAAGLTRAVAGFHSLQDFLRGFDADASKAAGSATTMDRATTLIGDHLGGIIRVAAGLALLPIMFSQIGQSAEGTAIGLAGMAAAGASIGSALGNAGLGAAVGLLAGIGKVLIGLGEDADLSAEEIAKVAKEIDGLGRHAAAAKLLDAVGSSLQGLSGDLVTAGSDLDEYSKGLDQTFGASGAQSVAAINIQDATDKVGKFNRAFADLAETSPAAADKVLKGLRDSGTIGPAELSKLEAALGRGKKAFEDKAVSSKEAADADKKTADAALIAAGDMDTQKQAAQDLAKEIDDLIKALNDLYDTQLKQNRAEEDFAGALQDLDKTVKENGTNLDINTEKGLKNRKALDDATEAARAKAVADAEVAAAAAAAYGPQAAQAAAVDAYSTSLRTNIDTLAEHMRALGFSDDQILTYIEDLYNIPPERRTEIHNTADLAKELVAEYLAQLLGVPIEVATDVINNSEASGIPVSRYIDLVRQGIPPSVATDIINTADAAGLPVSFYTSLLKGIPPDRWTDIINSAAAAGVPVSTYLGLVGSVPPTKHTDITASASTGDAESDLNWAARTRTAFINAVGIGLFAEGGIVGGPMIPVNAQGGMVVPATPGGRLFRVGEAGSPEVILPTNNDARAVTLLRAAGLGRLLGRGTTVNAPVNVNVTASGNRMRDMAAAREAGTIAARELLQRVRAG